MDVNVNVTKPSKTKSQTIRDLLAAGIPTDEIVVMHPNISRALVHQTIWKTKNPSGKKAKKKPQQEIKFLPVKQVDAVNHPPHYKVGGIETIDFIESKGLNYRLGNVVKYVSRAGHKVGSDPVEDLNKALFYLKREIAERNKK